MKEIIKWLREIEHLANNVYSQAALIYANDENFKSFLEHTAEEEAWHYHVMGSAAEYLSAEPDVIPVISVDDKTNHKIIKYFLDINKGSKEGTFSKAELIEKIVEVELSEWNDIFLYVVNFLKDRTGEFKYPAVRIQTHIKEIEHYLETVQGRTQALQKIKELPPVWTENILIVDDEEMITGLIKSLLNRSGNIDIAHDGQEALRMMDEKFYKLIVSDIDMPKMDGLRLYHEAVKKYPSSSTRFLFMTGCLSSERQAFFDERNIRYLAKPMNISALREEAAKIILLR